MAFQAAGAKETVGTVVRDNQVMHASVRHAEASFPTLESANSDGCRFAECLDREPGCVALKNSHYESSQ
jgi:hypothetical protein